MLFAVFAGVLLLASEPQAMPKECGEICHFRSTTGEILKLKGKNESALVDIYRDYIKCYRDDLAMFGSLWEAGKDVETVRNSDAFSWVGLCEPKRVAADAAASQLVAKIYGKDEASVRLSVERWRSGLAFTVAVVFYQKIGKFDAFKQYSQELFSAQNN